MQTAEDRDFRLVVREEQASFSTAESAPSPTSPIEQQITTPGEQEFTSPSELEARAHHQYHGQPECSRFHVCQGHCRYGGIADRRPRPKPILPDQSAARYSNRLRGPPAHGGVCHDSKRLPTFALPARITIGAVIASKNIGEREVIEKLWGWSAGKKSTSYQRVIKPHFPPFKLRKLPKFTAVVRHCEKSFRKRMIPPISPLGSYPRWFTDRHPGYTAIQWLRNKFQNARQ
jgi:hypothetical protein